MAHRMLGEGDRKPRAYWNPNDAEEQQGPTNDICGVQYEDCDENEPVQPDHLMGRSVSGSPEVTSILYHDNSFSNLGPPNYDSGHRGQVAPSLPGMPNGLEGLTMQTPAMGSDSPQLYQYDITPAMESSQQVEHTVDNTQPLIDSVPFNLRLTLNDSDYDLDEDNVQHRPAFQGWGRDVATNTTEPEAGNDVYQTLTNNTQLAPSQHLSSVTPYTNNFHWRDQMIEDRAGSSMSVPALTNFRRASDSPWSPYAQVNEPGPALNPIDSAASYHQVPADGRTASEFSCVDPAMLDPTQETTPGTSIPPASCPPWPDRSSQVSREYGDPNNVLSTHWGPGTNLVTTNSIMRDGRHVAQSGGLFRSTSNRLSVPDNAPAFAPPSPTLSNVSITPSNVAEDLECEVLGCNSTFSGHYRRGNRQRHYRMKHGHSQGQGQGLSQGQSQGQEERMYPCEEYGCSKVYKRQDARLKHYRKRHHHRAPGPPLSRKKYPSV
ncbi:Nn.00g018950.m01.CDS01 [Neocucurbitaria sp. VM-36]